MEGLSVDYKNIGGLLLGIGMILLGFGWSFIFWQGVSSIRQMKTSIDGLHSSVIKLFERTENHSDDIKELKHWLTTRKPAR